MKKFLLWLGAVSPVIYIVLSGLLFVDTTKITASVFIVISVLLALLMLVLISQHCWERMKQE